ncbi:hypothetical protein [Methylophaga sp. OBS3]|uniref:hypothetical protein n=1 Tax=Methylophaga sp. OBS3 TaxID=2991934 RepID=UPI002255332E|nr:hypothetical protein [Methylophaga sp. OBS3]MCX4190304.1 hypothetical protein [Methylophaga sp. OBS3]
MNLSVSKCLPLLEEYRQIFKPLIFERDTAMIRADNRQLTEKRKYLRQLQLSLHLLTQCYLRYAQQRFQRGKRPAEDPVYLLCLLRAAELLSLQVVNAFQHYYQPPDKAIWQLHQIYLYLESANCLKSLPEFKQPIEVTDFYTVYVRTLLTGIADPYNMPRFSVVKIFQLMGSLTNETDIDLMSEKQMHITSQFLLTGHFCINGQSDQLPLAMARTAVDIRSASDTRLLNVQPLLRRLDTIIKQQKNISAIERQVLTHAIPQLNGSYERQTERTTSIERRTVGVCYGLKAIHQMLSQEGKVNVQPWTLMNQGDKGLMLMRETADCRAIQIGDLIAFKETPDHNQLGIIRWLHIGPEQTRIGLSVLQGKASAEQCIPEGEMAEIPVISLNDDDKPSLLSQKGLFSPKRKIHLNTSEVKSLIGADQLLSSTLDYDYFSYKTLKIS